MPQVVASTFDLREQMGSTFIAALMGYFRPREMLLVLDNCEHVIAACAELVTTLLRNCPNLRVLATSREALNVDGESAWQVPPLSMPNPGKVDNVAMLQTSEAACLFIDRAAVQSAFTATDRNAQVIAQICRRLDGMPLAIELAAARVRALTVEQIAARLDDQFNLLSIGSRTAPARHQTLRAMIDWSYGLLSLAEKMLFRRLAVFAGGWTQDRHLDYCLQWAERARPHLYAAEQLTWLNRFEAEHDNLRAALDWSQTNESRSEKGLRLAGATGRFWRLRGYFSEGRARLSAALSQRGAEKRTDVHCRKRQPLRLVHYLCPPELVKSNLVG